MSTAIQQRIACFANCLTSCSIMPVLTRVLVRTLQVTILNTCQPLPMLPTHRAVLAPSLVLAASTTPSPVFPAKVRTSTCLISSNAFRLARLPTFSMSPNAHSAIPTATNAISQAPIALLARLACTLLLIRLVSQRVPTNIMRMIRPKVVRRAQLLALLATIAIFAVLVPLGYFTPKHASPLVLLKHFTTLPPIHVFLVPTTALLAKTLQVSA